MPDFVLIVKVLTKLKPLLFQGVRKYRLTLAFNYRIFLSGIYIARAFNLINNYFSPSEPPPFLITLNRKSHVAENHFNDHFIVFREFFRKQSNN